MASTARRPRRRAKQAEADHGAALARRTGLAARAAWHHTARAAGRLARRLPSPHRTPGLDLPGHDNAGLALLLTGLLLAATEWTHPAGLPGRLLDIPAGITGGLLGRLAPLPLLWLAVQVMRHPAGTHTVRILAQAAGIALTAAGVAGLLDLAATGIGGLLGRATGAVDAVLSAWGAVPLPLALVAAGTTAVTGISPVTAVTALAALRRRPALATPAAADDFDDDRFDLDEDDEEETVDAPPRPTPAARPATPTSARPAGADSGESPGRLPPRCHRQPRTGIGCRH
ncbi:hypothetical protein V6U90_25085 [Micromonospora sp. CPCC 206060]|uniref:hypothetical protein n=1 Tax=Micromonospora sp. CPCC 206060 TaxID=3122406 RepID=UPI002FEF40F0